MRANRQMILNVHRTMPQKALPTQTKCNSMRLLNKTNADTLKFAKKIRVVAVVYWCALVRMLCVHPLFPQTCFRNSLQEPDSSLETFVGSGHIPFATSFASQVFQRYQ